MAAIGDKCVVSSIHHGSHISPKPLDLFSVSEFRALGSYDPQCYTDIVFPKGPSIIMVYTYRAFWGSKYIP